MMNDSKGKTLDIYHYEGNDYTPDKVNGCHMDRSGGESSTESISELPCGGADILDYIEV